eukprot:Phypoly_transcript_23606.p1 GENE.Phypoly_transcript_23606~~Phypoly_transcript_23606.p1  ORF type:complete len:179 (+),score=59.87 Phypoly_transcript_23606:39-539(+)
MEQVARGLQEEDGKKQQFEAQLLQEKENAAKAQKDSSDFKHQLDHTTEISNEYRKKIETLTKELEAKKAELNAFKAKGATGTEEVVPLATLLAEIDKRVGAELAAEDVKNSLRLEKKATKKEKDAKEGLEKEVAELKTKVEKLKHDGKLINKISNLAHKGIDKFNL